jgi:HEPN domain-containing protein
LEELATGLKRQGLQIPSEVEDAAVLSSFAWETRYPSFAEPVSFEEYKEAVRQAEIVVAWAEKEIGR